MLGARKYIVLEQNMNKSYFYKNSNLISHNLRHLREAQFVKDFELVCFCQVLNITEKDFFSDFYKTYGK